MERQQRMRTLRESLLAKDIHLSLRATCHRDAVEELLSPLRGDGRVKDWKKLRTALASDLPDAPFGGAPSPIFFHHTRSESVSDLVLVAGRSDAGVSLAGHEGRVKLVFVAAIPEALNNEYLRILGAISRVCGDDSTLAELTGTPDAVSFLKILEKACRQ